MEGEAKISERAGLQIYLAQKNYSPERQNTSCTDQFLMCIGVLVIGPLM